MKHEREEEGGNVHVLILNVVTEKSWCDLNFLIKPLMLSSNSNFSIRTSSIAYWWQQQFAVFYKSCVWIFTLAVIAFQQRSLTCEPFSIVILDVCQKKYLEEGNPWLQKGIAAKNTDVFSRILLNVGLASGNFCWRVVIYFEKKNHDYRKSGQYRNARWCSNDILW